VTARLASSPTQFIGNAAPRKYSAPAEVLLLLAMLAPLFLLQKPSELPEPERTNGALLWLACVAPTALYVFRRPNQREPFPFFPLIGVVFGVYYALPALSGAVNLAYRPDQFRITYLDPARDFQTATELALWGWLLLLLGYWTLSISYRRVRSREQPWPARPLSPVLIGMLIIGLAAEALQVSRPLPGPVGGTIGFVSILSRFAIASLLVMRVRGQLAPGERAILLIAIPVQILLLLAAGSIAKVFLFVLLLLLAHWLGGGRLRASWIVAGFVAALALITLKGVLTQYRRAAWFAGVRLNVGERAVLMGQLVSDQVKAEGVVGAVGTGWEAAISRSATLDLLADATRRTPQDIPYWGGSTYLSLIGIAVPRVLWPSKPTKRLGQDFGHRYSYIESWDQSTSVNLPFLVEFYINFGTAGVLIGMFLTGMVYRVLDVVLNRPGQSVLRTIASMSILIPLLNVESDFSLVFGGIFLNAIAFVVVLRYLRQRVSRGAQPRTIRSSASRLTPTPPLEGV
jgi:hypothetical protein